MRVFTPELYVYISNSDYIFLVAKKDENGDIINVAFNDELSPGVRLIGISKKEVIFENGEDSLVVINFKNQIIERNN